MLIFTGRFQPFHNGHLSVINYLQKKYPFEKICIAVIKYVPLTKKKTAFDKYVDNMLGDERNPFDTETVLSLIEETIKEQKLNNVIVTLMPRASKETWGTITALFDCERTWVFTKNQTGIDDWEEKKSGFYQSMGDKIIRIPIVKDINGSEIRRALYDGDYEYLKHFVPQSVYEYLKQNLN